MDPLSSSSTPLSTWNLKNPETSEPASEISPTSVTFDNSHHSQISVAKQPSEAFLNVQKAREEGRKNNPALHDRIDQFNAKQRDYNDKIAARFKSGNSNK